MGQATLKNDSDYHASGVHQVPGTVLRTLCVFFGLMVLMTLVRTVPFCPHLTDEGSEVEKG